MKRKSFNLLLLLLLCSCAMNKLETEITDKKHDGLADETLLRYSSSRITALYQDKNQKLSALAKCHNKSIDRGLQHLKKLYKDHKKDFDYWNKIGTCYYLGNADDKAEFFFNHSLDISKESGKKNPNAYNNLGVIFLKNRHYDQAYQMFVTSKEQSPRLLTPLFNMAQLYIQFGHTEKAEKTLRNLHLTAPLDVDILASLGTVMLIKHQYQQAKGYFTKIDQHNLKRADISNHYAMTLYKLGQYRSARDILKNQNVSTIESVVDMRKKLTRLINEALEKEKRQKLTAQK